MRSISTGLDARDDPKPTIGHLNYFARADCVFETNSRHVRPCLRPLQPMFSFVVETSLCSFV
jgi:hypothetical protein